MQDKQLLLWLMPAYRIYWSLWSARKKGHGGPQFLIHLFCRQQARGIMNRICSSICLARTAIASFPRQRIAPERRKTMHFILRTLFGPGGTEAPKFARRDHSAPAFRVLRHFHGVGLPAAAQTSVHMRGDMFQPKTSAISEEDRRAIRAAFDLIDLDENGMCALYISCWLTCYAWVHYLRLRAWIQVIWAFVVLRKKDFSSVTSQIAGPSIACRNYARNVFLRLYHMRILSKASNKQWNEQSYRMFHARCKVWQTERSIVCMGWIAKNGLFQTTVLL